MNNRLKNFYKLIEEPCYFISVQFQKHDARRYTYKVKLDMIVENAQYVVVPTVNGLQLAKVTATHIMPPTTLEYQIKWIVAAVDINDYVAEETERLVKEEQFDKSSQTNQNEVLQALMEYFHTSKDTTENYDFGPDIREIGINSLS